MKIRDIKQNSTGHDLGLKVGDHVLKINGNPVRDILDYRFLISEEELELEVLQGGDKIVYEIEKDYDDNLGLGFEEIEIRFCGNDCPFCFVDQNPNGMRASVYFRDEDFRLSFLSGHYVTLTNLSKRDMDRIVWQRLSPIFVSVHATDPQIRKFLFGIKHDDHLLEKLEFLTGNGIEIHTQIVLCPEINDGGILKKTIWDLAEFLPNLRSVSIVPVGLTKHRQGLKKLHPVTHDYAKELLGIVEVYAEEFQKKTGEYFVYAGDEFYIMAGAALPDAERYDGFYQKENGVGMVRYFLDDFENQKREFPKKLSHPAKATLVTATLASDFMNREIISALNQVGNFQAQLAVVKNQFYGSSIHITGLLTAQDIFRQLSKMDLGDRVYLPANCLKEAHLFLDDWTIDDLSAKLDCPVEALDNDFAKIFEGLN